jgi:UDP-GlcNAc3NAcA epimerase
MRRAIPNRNREAVPKAKHRIVSIVGARPQFIKALPFSRAVRAQDDFEEVMVHTGQHFDRNMSDIFFDELKIERPRHHLNINGGGHGAMTGRMLGAIEEVLLAERPEAVIVYGDTNSTVAGALAAAKLHIPVVHAEAGMRSFNRRMPEELNRVMADHLSAVLLCATTTAVENLKREGIVKGVHKVGDLMYDATLLTVPLAKRHSTILKRLGLKPKKYGVATVHRAENTDHHAMLAEIAEYLRKESRKRPIILPLHPRTRQALRAAGIDFDSGEIKIVDPLGYIDMCRLVHSAEIVLTDSGGLQKEAYFHRVPCVTLRTETEWVETIDCGWNRLWTVPEYQPQRRIKEYGNGQTAEQILKILTRLLQRKSSKRRGSKAE